MKYHSHLHGRDKAKSGEKLNQAISFQQFGFGSGVESSLRKFDIGNILYFAETVGITGNPAGTVNYVLESVRPRGSSLHAMDDPLNVTHLSQHRVPV